MWDKPPFLLGGAQAQHGAVGSEVLIPDIPGLSGIRPGNPILAGATSFARGSDQKERVACESCVQGTVCRNRFRSPSSPDGRVGLGVSRIRPALSHLVSHPKTFGRAHGPAARGWELRDTGFVVQSPETREMFFPKGSPWDAFVLVRDTFAKANESITIVDPFCDTTVFQLLIERNLEQLHIQILCGQYADAVAAGAATFMTQYPGVTVEVRTTGERAYMNASGLVEHDEPIVNQRCRKSSLHGQLD